MSVAVLSLPPLDNSYARAVEELSVEWQAAAVPAPRLLALNEPLAEELGIDPAVLRSPEGVAVLAGNAVPEGAVPAAQAYAGHQFGGLSPRLGDGRALLLGELVDGEGRRRDLHLKGSGRTPFSRGGDGKAAVGPMLREYVIGEAMHALGIPTSRALAVVATGEQVLREEGPLPGAVLTRVAASHLRVGTFQYAAMHHGPDVVRRLADYAIARHHPEAAEADNPYLALFDAVIGVQAELIPRWMHVGFIHGVMNTDNITISGETIDYGPCAFMEAFDPATVFSSIDHGGRYAYGNQPVVAQWNLARLAESLLPLIGEDSERAVAVAMERLNTFTARCEEHWIAGMRAKLGLTDADDDDTQLVTDVLAFMRETKADFTSFFRGLAPDRLPPELGRRWEARGIDVNLMDGVNPVYVPRNHLVEEALVAASEQDDLAPLERLLDAVTQPFDERPGLERYAEPAPAEFCAGYRTFCGT